MMKKLITFLMLLSVFGIGNVWADEVETFNYTSLTSNPTTQNGITVSFSKGSHSNSGFWHILICIGFPSGSVSKRIRLQCRRLPAMKGTWIRFLG